VYLGPEELVARAEEDAPDAAPFQMIAYTGRHLGEPLRLQWGDIDSTAGA
jgi:integrase